MQSPTWVRARELNDWAKSPAAKALLPELVARLVKATVPKDDLSKCDFPAEAETHRPGYDGTTVTDKETLYVPLGIGYWELGCDARPEHKAQDDYETRVREHEARIAAGETDEISQATFIALTTRDWHAKKAPSRKNSKGKVAKKKAKPAAPGEGMEQWAQARSKEKRFKEVIAYDSSRLEQWIREAPAVGLWLAKEMGKRIVGVTDVDSHWLDVQGAFRRPLPPEVLLVNRASIATAFKDWLAGPARELAVRAPSALEVVAVFTAWVHTLPSGEADAVSSRAIIVEDRDTWRALATSPHPLILIAAPQLDADRELFSGAARKGHFVLRHAETRSAGRANVVELDQMRRFDLQQALQKAGLEEAEARQIAQGAGGNFTILRRIFARHPEVQSPAWAKQQPVLATLLLAGAWEDERPNDRYIIERLSGVPYADARAVAAKWRAEADAPLRLILKDRGVGKTWEFLSPLDAWESLRWELGPSQMAAFEEAAVEVLGEDDPALSLPAEERPMAAIKGKVWKFSHDLRQGIAEILAIGANREDESNIAQELGFAKRAASIVARVLPTGCDWKRWASLGQLLSSLVEAAPEALLTAIERDLASPDPQIIELLRQEVPPSGIGGAAYHSGLLWALETAAWAPEHQQRVALILGQLTERDPGGKWGNRPLGSAVRIFFSWRPQTVASVRDRIESLELMARQNPGAAWKILLGLIPSPLGMFMDSSKPTYRNWAAGWTGEVTYADHFALMDAVSEISVRLARAEPDRWPELLDQLSHMHAASASAYRRIRDAFGQFVTGEISKQLQEQLWRKLTAFVQQHTRFADADWAVPADELARWAELRDALSSDDAVVNLAHLFDNDGWADLDDSLTYEQKAERRGVQRRAAVREIFGSGGMTEIKRLAKRVQQPWAVGWSLAEELGAKPENEIIPDLLASDDEQLQQLARAYAAQRIHVSGTAWAVTVPQESWSAEQIAAWSLQMNFGRETWDWITSKGADVERLYWKSAPSWGGGSLNLTDAARAVARYQAAGRPMDAVQFLMSRPDIKQAANTEMLCAALEAVLQVPLTRQIGTMDAHYIREALSFLQQKESQADETRVAKIEFAFLPLLDPHFLLPKALQRQLARDPQFFVDCLRLLFRARNAAGELEDNPSDDSESLEVRKDRAQRIWRLLHDWQTIPGTDDEGVVVASSLRAWLDEARAQARQAGRLEVADVKIGEVFAKSPPDADGGIPLVAVREAIEEVKSDVIERGFSIGLHNLRGVYSKDLYEGGKQERELAEKFEGYAKICSRWPRTAKALRSVAADYRREAKEEDERAKARA